MKKLTISSLLCFLFLFVYPQQDDVRFSGTFKNTPFDKFAASIEEQTSCRFQYKEEWIKDVKVNTAGNNQELKAVLKEILNEYSLNFYIDKNKIVIVYPGQKIVETLPDYVSVVAADEAYLADTTGAESELTNVERNYIEGKKEIKTAVKRVGQGSKFFAGRKCAIRGKIRELESGQAIVGATIFIEETGSGAASDLDGYFNLVLEQGEYNAVVRSVSMKENKFILEVYSDGELNIDMEKEVISLNEVRVVAAKNDNVVGMQMGFERMTSKSMKEIPAVMGEKDILKVAQLLPGVQSAGEGSSGLYVRGGGADQNMFYINKIPVYNTSHLFGFFSAFSSDIVNSFSLYKSNIPAQYGGRLSSVFDVTTRRGNKKEFYGKGGVSLVTGHFALEGPVIKDKTSFVLNYRGTYSDWLLKKIDDVDIQNSNAMFYDVSAALNTEINKNNSLKIFGYKSQDEFSLASTDDYDYSNTGASINWQHLFSSAFHGDFALVHSQYFNGHNSKGNVSEAYRHEFELGHTELKADFQYHLKNDHQLAIGAGAIYYNNERGELLPYGDESTRISIDLGEEQAVESAVYLSDEFDLSARLRVLAGLRYSRYSLLGPQDVNIYYDNSSIDENNIKEVQSFGSGEIVKTYSGIEPRLSLNYDLRLHNSVKASYNRNNQYIFMLSNSVAISPTDMWKLSDYHLEPPVSEQVSLGYYHNFPKQGLETSVEIYKKWINNVVEYKDGVDFLSGDPTEMLLLQGTQDTHGLEFMLKKKTGKLSGMMSYCYSKSMVQVKSDIATEQINNGQAYPSNYDKPHSFNLAATYKTNMRVSLSTIVEYSTGRPITYPITSYYSNGQEILYYSERNAYRIPNYFRVDFSVNVEGNLKKKKKMHSYWMLNVYNVTGRKNAYSIYYESDNGSMKAYKLSIFGQPIVTLSWNFKFGNYTSE